MRSRCFVYRAVCAIACSAACQSATDTYPFAEAARARVTGSVITPAGAPLDDVLVAISLPTSVVRLGYTSAPGMTGSTGQFQSEVVRLKGAPAFAAPDTISGYAVATAIGRQYKAGAGGGFPTDSVPVAVQFTPSGQTPATTVVQVRLTIP